MKKLIVFFRKELPAQFPLGLKVLQMSAMIETTNEAIVFYPEYKTYKGFKYHLNFPENWMIREVEGTGRQCVNCVGESHDGHAMWRGIILGYCGNCSVYKYNESRGKGWYGHGVQDPNSCGKSYKEYLGSAEIDFENYGDIEANPEDTLENQRTIQEMFEDGTFFPFQDYDYVEEFTDEETVTTMSSEDDYDDGNDDIIALQERYPLYDDEDDDE
jgi:hypothetical protein